jgi:hypothetical protein
VSKVGTSFASRSIAGFVLLLRCRISEELLLGRFAEQRESSV